MDIMCIANCNFMATAIATMVLLVLPMVLPIIRKFHNANISKIASVGGGMAIAAVFVFLMPDVLSKIKIVSANTNIAFLKHEHHLMFLVFVTFLAAFCTMYALEKIALDRTKIKAKPDSFVFYLHMAILCAMLIALVSSFPALAASSAYAIGIVCALAVFEIFLEEIALLKHFEALYSYVGRYLMMIAIVAGWGIGFKFFNQETTTFTLLTQAFVIGMILTAVIKNEFDAINQSNNYTLFIVAVVFKVFIIFGVIAIEDANALKKSAASLNTEKN